jgi:hypothetical protein
MIDRSALQPVLEIIWIKMKLAYRLVLVSAAVKTAAKQYTDLVVCSHNTDVLLQQCSTINTEVYLERKRMKLHRSQEMLKYITIFDQQSNHKLIYVIAR